MDQKRKLGAAPFVAFDTETTGTGPGARLVEIAGVRFAGDQIIDRFATLIDPGVPIPPESSAVHQITDAMVKGRPAARDVLERFFAFSRDAWLVAHNAPFDLGMVGLELTRHRMPAPAAPALDTLRASRRLFPGGSHSLDALIGLLGLPRPATRHRASADAEVLFHLVRKLIDSLGGDELSVAALVEHAGPALAFESYILAPPALPAPLRHLEEACRKGTKVNLHLDGGGSRAPQRIVSPKVLYEWNGVGYLEAFCAEEGHSVSFRLDRIARAEPGASSGFLF